MSCYVEVHITCDGKDGDCVHSWKLNEPDPEAARDAAERRLDWDCSGDTDLCPDCKEEGTDE